MTKKFSFLRFIAGVYKAFGIILLIAAILGAIFAIVGSILGGAFVQNMGGDLGLEGAALGGVLGGIVSGAAILLGLGLAAVCQFAISEAILVFLTIEENTRATAGLLARQS